MKNTGFSEISETRLDYVGTDPWYCEIALTGRCNFSCEYCKRFDAELSTRRLASYLDTFSSCRHIQLTGGEPTLHSDFLEIVDLCREKADAVSLSTNGSFGADNYLKTGIRQFSISLDDYDHSRLRRKGYANPQVVEDSIRILSETSRVIVGVVVDDQNVDRIEKVVDHALSLGAADIKLAVVGDVNPTFTGSYDAYPILKYRVENFAWSKSPRPQLAPRCHLAENDVAIVGDYHYSCMVYFREGGKPIGNLSGNVSAERLAWARTHEPRKDPICQRYCMDFKCEYNRAKAARGWAPARGRLPDQGIVTVAPRQEKRRAD